MTDLLKYEKDKVFLFNVVKTRQSNIHIFFPSCVKLWFCRKHVNRKNNNVLYFLYLPTVFIYFYLILMKTYVGRYFRDIYEIKKKKKKCLLFQVFFFWNCIYHCDLFVIVRFLHNCWNSSTCQRIIFINSQRK